jgi:hypothetical protein
MRVPPMLARHKTDSRWMGDHAGAYRAGDLRGERRTGIATPFGVQTGY